MTKYVRVENNIVMEKYEGTELFPLDALAAANWFEDTIGIAEEGWVHDPVAETFSVPPGPTDDELKVLERSWRDNELINTDKWGLSDRTMTAEMTTYRQELRDMPTLIGFPASHTRPKLSP